METTVHIVFPHENKASCPDAIGHHLAAALSRRYRVLLHEWRSFSRIHPGPNDVLIGHACPLYMTLFRRSYRANGWKRVLLMSPYCHRYDHPNAYNESIIRHCDLYLTITGNYWFEDVSKSGFAHWLPKMRHLDLAVDREDFPVLKKAFNLPGERKFLFIGREGWTGRYKNVFYLMELAAAMPEASFGWIGTASDRGNIQGLGCHDFRTGESRRLVAEYDFMLTVGQADANPATILEAMAWGLIPVCTPQSGYSGYEGIVNIPLAPTGDAVRILRALQGAPESALRAKQQDNWRLLDDHFNWERFAAQVVEAIESSESPACLPISFKRRCAMLKAELTNPLWVSLMDPRKLIRRLQKLRLGVNRMPETPARAQASKSPSRVPESGSNRV